MNNPDADQPRGPIVEPRKRTTKVNFGVVVAVVTFLALGTLAMCTVSRNPPQDEEQVVPGGTPPIP